MALDASVVLRSSSGERRVPAAEFVLGSRRTARAPHELVVAIEVPSADAAARSVFIKLGGRRHLTISMTMVAVVIGRDTNGTVTRAGIAVGSCAARARRLPALEAKLIGQPHGAALGEHVHPNDLGPLTPIDDLRASAAYRLDATATLLQRALAELST